MTVSPRSRPAAVAAALAAALVLTAAVAPPAPAPLVRESVTATSPTEYLVTMGAVDPAVAPNTNPPGGAGRTDRFEYLAYYPSHLQVHRGDTVFFRRDGFHTAVFDPDLATAPRQIRRDELEGVSVFDGNAATDPTCVGGPSAPPCVLDDPTQHLASGFNSMRVAIDLPVGTYAYYCQVHDGMAGSIEVVDDDEQVAPPAEVLADAVAEVAQDTVNGEAVIAAGQTPEVRTVDDHRAWTVKVGDFTPDGRVAALRFLPSSLRIEPGDEVEFAVPGGGSAPMLDPSATGAFELHTVSFPPEAYPFGFLTYLNPTCDPDEVDGGLPGVPLRYEALLVGCQAGTTFEFQYQPWAWQTPLSAPGGVIASPQTPHDSGVLAPATTLCRSACDPWSGERVPDSTTAVFPNAGSFAYVCNVHPEWGMAGGIEVAS